MSAPFAHHEIVDRVETDTLGSWLMQRRHEDGGLASDFWVRVTAANGVLSVVGDFAPTVFAHGPRNPIACVRWMGDQGGVTSYASEKARTGMGGSDKIAEWDPDLARSQLRDMLADAKDEREQDAEDFGPERVEVVDYEITDMGEPSRFEQALQAGLDLPDCYSGRTQVDQMIIAVIDVDSDAIEAVGNIGRKPAASLELAMQALSRLVELLECKASQ